MASPQLENGYTRTANELSEAIMQSNFSKRQRNILDLIIRMSYGCGKKSAVFKYVDFELVGVYKADIKRELDYLSSVRVITAEYIDDLSMLYITLNKNYDQWRVSIVKGFNTEKWEQLLRRNLDDKVSEILTNPENKVSKTLTDSKKTVSNLPTEQNRTVSKILTNTFVEFNNDKEFGSSKERSFKETDLKETTTININSKSMIEMEPKEVADVVGGDEDFRELEKLRARITGNIFPSANEMKAMSDMLKLLPISQIKVLIEAAFKAYKPQYEGDRIRVITYFLPLIQKAAAAVKSRAAPEVQKPAIEHTEESEDLTQELMNLIPEWMAKEAVNSGRT